MNEIVICPACKGTGTHTIETPTDYHKGLYDYTTRECTRCDGKGRLIKVVTTSYKKLP